MMFWDYAQHDPQKSTLLEVRALGGGRVLLNGVPVDEWDALVNRVSRHHQRIWNRGEDNGRGGIQHSTRIVCKPKLDLIHQIGQFLPSDFDAVFDRSLISELGNVAPLDDVIRMKLQANRGKDFRHFMKLIQMISNP